MLRAAICVVVLSAAATPIAAYGQSGPVLLKNKCKTSVNLPTDGDLRKIDNGYLMDETCKTVFVRPPTRGDFRLSGIAKSGMLGLCEAYGHIQRGYTLATEQYEKAIGDGDANKAANFLILATSALDHLQKYNDIEGFSASGLLSVDWNRLVQTYHDNNPTLQVRPLPLVGSYLTYTAKGVDKDALGSALKALGESSERMSALITSKIPGLKPIDLGLKLDSPSGDPSVLFGSSLSGQVVLNLHGACPYYKDGVIQIKDNSPVASLYPYIVANVQYFYPIRVESGYKIEFDADVVAEWLSTIIIDKGTFSNRQVADKLFSLQGQTGFKITIFNDDFNNNASPADLSEVKRELTMTFAYSIINKLADPILQVQNPLPNVVPPTDPYYEVQGTRTECRSINFIGITLRRDCSNVYFKARQPTDGHAFGKSSITNAAKLVSTGAVVNSYFILQRDSLSFLDVGTGQ